MAVDSPLLDVRCMGVGNVRHGYETVWRLQRTLHEAVADGEVAPVALVLEHETIFTAGTRTQPTDLPSGGDRVINVDRGGRITWHGPGQLVCYPIVPLPHPFDVVAHVRRLEQVAIDTCSDFGIIAGRIAGRSGVWIDAASRARPAKIAAVGVRVARGVTMHGLALNVDCDLAWADRIIPCGLPDADVTSMQVELDHPIGVGEVLPRFVTRLVAVVGGALPRASAQASVGSAR